MKNTGFFGASPFVAYIAAVTVATGCFVTLVTLFAMYKGGSETGNSLSMKASHLAFVMLIQFVVGWLFAFITAIIPFVIGWNIASRLEIRSAVFVILGGTVTGILLSPLFTLIPSLGINVQGEEPSLLQNISSIIPFFAASGLAAGGVCWRIIRSKTARINTTENE
jgi:hypothetical protein